MGYMKMPKKTQEAIDDNGFLHSGDIGKKDKDGFLYITGRLKELIITHGGENVPPVLIEQTIKKHCSALANVCVIGDKKKYLTCLVSLKTLPNHDTGIPTNKLRDEASATAKEIGSEATTVEGAVKCDKFQKHIYDCIKAANEEATSRAQKVQYFRILPVDLSAAGGELTPTLKTKRRIVNDKYKDLIDTMYHGRETVSFYGVEGGKEAAN